jgi:hypothetical protein
MKVKPILVVGIALFAAACATVTTKGTQPGTTASTPAVGDGPPGVGSSQQGPSLNGDDAAASRPDSLATGVTVDAVRVVGGQLLSNAPRHE